jgi:excinuclease ABC subunit A
MSKNTSKRSIDDYSPEDYIVVKGARLHNLKNLDVAIPRNKFVVITGLSGSGKSSLAFDTIYAEGQRRYVESLSSYARQFLGRLNKPEVDYIRGLAPAVAIEQKVNTRNPRSTVGTTTEIYDYLKLLYARIGRTISPVSGDEVKRDSVSDVVDFILGLEENTKLMVMSPLAQNPERTVEQEITVLIQQGFSRIWSDKKVMRLEDLREEKSLDSINGKYLIIDRIAVKHDDEDLKTRLADSIQTAFYEGHGECTIWNADENSLHSFSNRFEADGIIFDEPTEHLFSFNNPFGACPKCEGYGSIIGIDEDLVIPNKNLSVYEDAVACWNGDSMSEFKENLIRNAYEFDFPVHTPYHELSDAEKDLLWNGNKYFVGINEFFEFLESKSYKIQNRVMLARYRGKTKCPECNGKRLRKEATYVQVGGKAITELVDLPVNRLYDFFRHIELSDHEREVARRILVEIESRLSFLMKVGLNYLTINRRSSTLSGGESQRINLATSLGSSLVGSMYILDEPSIGLHSKDTERLIEVLSELRDLGNSVIVVEHDEDIIRAADYVIDIGPEAGTLGGQLVFSGKYDELISNSNGLTANYLTGRMEIPLPETRRKSNEWIQLKGARHFNLNNVNIEIPLRALTVVTGVSGSGKSTLIKEILYPAMKRELGGNAGKPGEYESVQFNSSKVSDVELVDQNPIGKSSRSNPVTYIKAYDDIRNLFAGQKLSKMRGYKAKHFSFNVPGGRCETCQGEGSVTIEMQFLADVTITCEECNGKRFKDEVLEVKYAGKSIYDILELTIDEAITFFRDNDAEKIANKLQPLQDVGLGYVHLGQSSSTLSGGEAQRVKLASFLGKGSHSGKMVFIFDEPTTGLHFHDVNKLLTSFNALIDNGHTVIVIEHHLDIAKNADWLIDLGPEGGENGGNILFMGNPEEMGSIKESHTTSYMLEKLGMPEVP